MKQENRRHDIEIAGAEILYLLATFVPFIQRGGNHVKVPTITNAYGNTGLGVGDYLSLTIPVDGFYTMGITSRINKQHGDAIRVGAGFHLGDIDAFKADPTLVDLSYADLIEYKDIWGPISGGDQHINPNIKTAHPLSAGEIWSVVTLSDMHDTSAISFGEESVAWIRFLGTAT